MRKKTLFKHERMSVPVQKPFIRRFGILEHQIHFGNAGHVPFSNRPVLPLGAITHRRRAETVINRECEGTPVFRGIKCSGMRGGGGLAGEKGTNTLHK